MISIISPAKTIKLDRKISSNIDSSPIFKKESEELSHILKAYSPEDISELMKISTKLSELNFFRYQSLGLESNNKEKALIAFWGDVYKSLNINDFNENDFNFSQKHLRILSGLYGILKPMDAIEPYRLEMGIPLKTDKGNNLYEFWDDKITKSVNTELDSHEEKVLLNIASEEYSKVIDFKKINHRVVNVFFKEFRKGKYQIVSIYAKKARGSMARYVIKNSIDRIEKIKDFNDDGYEFNLELSDFNNFVFTRE